MIENPWPDPKLIWIPIPRAGLPPTEEPAGDGADANRLMEAMQASRKRADDLFEQYRQALAEAEACKRAVVRLSATLAGGRRE